MKYLRRVGMVSALALPAASPGDDLITEYVEYLRHDCGLAPNSVLVYVPLIRDWLSDHVARMGGVAMDAFDAATIQRFLVDILEFRGAISTHILHFPARVLVVQAGRGC